MKYALPLSALVLTSCVLEVRGPQHELQPPVIALVRVRELSLPRALGEGRGAFISAASGLVEHGGDLYFVSDDEFSIFIQKAGRELQAFPLKTMVLPANHKERRRAKPDFEALALLSQSEWPPHGAVVAWPSGSTLNRMSAYVVPFKDDDTLDEPIERDILPLAYELTSEAGELNIEGLFIRDGKVFLLQRGNSRDGKNGIFQMPLKDWMTGLRTGDWSKGSLKFRSVEMGSLNNVKLTLADAVWTPYGLLGLASAEDTRSAYADGFVMGTALVRIVDGRSEILGVFPPHVKLEGLLLERELADGSLHLLLVDDADDDRKPSSLYRAMIDARQLQTLTR